MSTGIRSQTLKTLRHDLPLLPPAPADPRAWIESALRHNPLLFAQQQTIEAAAAHVARAPGTCLRCMALAREIMEAHGGRVALLNRAEGGLHVALTLPLRSGSA